jgi:SAM-dependent methyltransferase
MKSTEKFTGKADYYSKYRPSYPDEFIDYLHYSVGIGKSSAVADIGAGTGILTRLISPISGRVLAVEPNESMRNAGIKYCEDLANVDFFDGCAENTGLNEYSLDFITVAQAFHWFDKEKAKAEFRRILKPEGKVILVWNSRVSDNEMVIENESILRRLCKDFTGFSGGPGSGDESISAFFSDNGYEERESRNDRVLSLEEFIGGSLSASYSPKRDDPNYDDFVESLKMLFSKYNVDGKLVMPNITRSYTGIIDP